MDKWLQGFIKVERSFQIAALVGVVLLTGYLGMKSYCSNASAPTSLGSPTSTQ
jgi:hypothetical protein